MDSKFDVIGYCHDLYNDSVICKSLNVNSLMEVFTQLIEIKSIQEEFNRHDLDLSFNDCLHFYNTEIRRTIGKKIHSLKSQKTLY